ncbi:hypothetical protein [Parasulfitobacter algicola]|uniref:Uncharacterized protein n=1 Tax=Parasulfitobacter algicola TaxID=2614809 RepID=A0ABX2IQ21_9RHOB|nr:hypothetical protein [Sulfitobacter algicola]NSX54455.1 hypothetical protein [Sulfitobacter algicola]
MRLWLYRTLTVGIFATSGANFYALSQNPFANPIVARTTEDAKRALTLTLKRTVTVDWIAPRLDQATVSGNIDDIEMLFQLADMHDVIIPADQRAAAQKVIDDANTMTAQIADCAICAVDIQQCKRLSQIAACAVPFELTPLGDLNALNRAKTNVIMGQPVDMLDAGLAIVGLGATAATLHSGGSSLTVKAGASLLRLGRRIGSVTPAFTRVLRKTADIDVNWSAVPAYTIGTKGLDDVVDAAQLVRLQRLAGNLGEVRKHTSLGDTLGLMRHVDSAEDAASLARVARAQGPATRATFYALGKARTFRAIHRLSDLLMATYALLAALVTQVLVFAAGIIRRMLRPI